MESLNLPGTLAEFEKTYPMHEFELDGCKCKVIEPLSPLPGKRRILKSALR